MTAAKKKSAVVESVNPIRTGEFAEPHRDLRDWLERAESIGELLRVKGCHWDLEIGAVAEML